MSKLKLSHNVTSVALVNNTAKTIDLTPGAGIRWKVISAKMFNIDDVARNVSMILYDGSNNILEYVVVANSLNQNLYQMFPSANHYAISECGYPGHNPMMEGTDYMRFLWAAGGASTGGTDADGLAMTVLEEAI